MSDDPIAVANAEQGSIPIGVVGLTFQDTIESTLRMSSSSATSATT